MLLFFTELLVRGTALCLLIALALLLLRRAAATYRHLLCTLALCGLLTLPLIQELLPPLPLLKATKPVAIAAPVAPTVLPEPLSIPASSRTEPIPRPLPSGQGRGEGAGISPPSLSQGGWRSEERTEPGGFWPLVWALGAAILLLRLAVALVRLRGLAKRSQHTTLLGTEILVSECITTPLTWGVRRPVILLPAALLSGDPAVAESALRHEKAHIARRDWLWHLLAEVVCALCWFQPGAWWLRRRLRAESERACDDRVLLSGVSGPDYAAHLLEILKVGRANSLAPGMAAVGSMELRVKHILDSKKPRRAHGLRLALTAVLGLVLLPLASLKVAAKPGERPVSRLQAAVEQLAPKLAFLTPSALLAQAKAALVAPKPLAPMALAEPTLAQPNGTLAMPQPLTPTQVPPAPESPKLALNRVVWEKALDGLQPGILLTGPGQVSPGGKISYQVLIRNTTNKPIEFIVQCLPNCERHQRPYLVPDSEMARIGAGQAIPAQFRTPERTVWMIFSEYIVTLAPQESVQVPGDFTLALGRGGNTYPYIETVQPGKNWLVQPVKVHQITPAERTKYTRLQGEFKLTKIDAVGKVREESEVQIVESGEGKLLFPRAAVEVVSPAPAGEIPPTLGPTIPLNKVVWGEVVDGLEPGFLLLSSDPVPQNSKVVYQALLRNKSDKPISFFVRMLRDNGPDRPWFGVRRAEGTGEPPPFEPLYEASLAPGEAMLVPVQQSIDGTQELVFGHDGSKERDRVSESWLRQYRITQPITLYRGLEKSQLTRLLGSAVPEIKKISSDGTLRTVRSSRAAGGKTLPGAQTLEATRMLDVVAALPSAPGPIIQLDKVIWKEAVDGLQAGFLLTSSPRVPMNSKLNYQTLVRNVSNKPLSFMTRLLQYDGYETPTVNGKPTKGAKRTYPLDPLYEVTLTPGESVIVPAQNGRENLEIYVGEGGGNDSPSIAEITPGHQKIVQPITIYRAPDHSKLPMLEGIAFLTRVSPDGRVSMEGATRASGGEGRIKGGQTLEAYIFLEIGTLNAAAPRNAASAVWGKVDKGFQCGIRMLTDQRVFKTGDTLEAEILWRNTSGKTLHQALPRQFELWPTILNSQGNQCLINQGARFDLFNGATDHAPGEVRSLGILKVKLVPEGTSAPRGMEVQGHVTLEPGTYTFSGSGGVNSGGVAFTVVGNTPQSQFQKAV